jgi:hypothetical protein
MTQMIIRGTPSRGTYIRLLKEQLPQAQWCLDRLTNSEPDGRVRCYENYLQALKLAAEMPAIHMEEDIFLTTNFIEKIETQIALRPNRVLQFFSMRPQDVTIGSREDDNFGMTQCFYLPQNYSSEFLPFATQWRGRSKDPGAIDWALRDWLRSRKEQYWIICPNLVNHIIGVSASVSRRPQHRVSRTFMP